jgi:hypothetical protein
MTEQVENQEIVTTEESIGVNDEAQELQTALSEALQNAIGSKKADSEPEEPEEVVDEIEEVEEEASDDVEVDSTEEVEDATEEKDEEFPIIPRDWSDAEKEKFQAVLDNPELKDQAAVLMKRYGDLKKGFYNKALELAEIKKSTGAWDEVFDANAKDSLGRLGVTEQQYVQSLLNVDRQLSQDPANGIKMLMEAYKVSPDQLGLSKGSEEGSEDDYYEQEDKRISQLEKQIADLKASAEREKAAATQQQNQSVEQQLRDFKHAIDDNGELLYPMFDEVKEEMSILLNSGKAETLEDAYKKSPSVREKEFERKAEERAQAQLKADKKKVADAKRASRGVKNKVSAPVKTRKKMSIEEHLAESFKAHGVM